MNNLKIAVFAGFLAAAAAFPAAAAELNIRCTGEPKPRSFRWQFK